MKKYKVEVVVKVHEQTEGYLPVKNNVDFTINENIPEGVSPKTYTAQRLSEEIKRNFDVATLDWQPEDSEEVLI